MDIEEPIYYEDVIKAIDDFEKKGQERVNKKPNIIIPYYTLDHLITELSITKKEFARLNKQLEKKDTVIDLMAKKMAFEGAGRKLFSCDFRIETGKCDENGCESCIKKYYKKKASEEKC